MGGIDNYAYPSEKKEKKKKREREVYSIFIPAGGCPRSCYRTAKPLVKYSVANSGAICTFNQRWGFAEKNRVISKLLGSLGGRSVAS